MTLRDWACDRMRTTVSTLTTLRRRTRSRTRAMVRSEDPTVRRDSLPVLPTLYSRCALDRRRSVPRSRYHALSASTEQRLSTFFDDSIRALRRSGLEHLVPQLSPVRFERRRAARREPSTRSADLARQFSSLAAPYVLAFHMELFAFPCTIDLVTKLSLFSLRVPVSRLDVFANIPTACSIPQFALCALVQATDTDLLVEALWVRCNERST